MKRGLILFLMIFLIIPFALADITIQTDQTSYNLGNKIKVSASVLQDKSFEGLFKLVISCGSYQLQYFLTPISLEANFRTALNVPDLITTSSMMGSCSIIGNLLTNDNLPVDGKESNGFEVVNELNILPVKTSISALPGGNIPISGVVNEAFGNNVLKAPTKIILDEDSYEVEAIDGKFNLTLPLAKNIKSGKHTIDISASDSKNNLGTSSIELFVTAIPTYIKNSLSSDKLLPGSKVEITSSLYDQADDLINTTLNLDLSHNNNIFKKIVQSNEKIEYEFSQYADPGLYTLSSAYKNLLTQSSINITTIREVKIRYENETVVVENTGNVPFEDELTFILQSEEKKYPLAKKIKVEPGKILNVDLSKEVPLGIYNILVPLKEGLAPFQKKLNETLGGAKQSVQEGLSGILPGNEDILASEVTIHDNRPIYKKIATSFSTITGTLVGANGLLTRNPLIAPISLFVIVSLLVLRYGRKPIMRLIKRKKDEGKGDDI